MDSSWYITYQGMSQEIFMITIQILIDRGSSCPSHHLVLKCLLILVEAPLSTLRLMTETLFQLFLLLDSQTSIQLLHVLWFTVFSICNCSKTQGHLTLRLAPLVHHPHSNKYRLMKRKYLKKIQWSKENTEIRIGTLPVLPQVLQIERMVMAVKNNIKLL